MSDDPMPPPTRRGWLVPIGGALGDPAIFERFLALCGGGGARVAVIPVASRLARAGDEYAETFRHHGAGEAVVLDFRSRLDGAHPDAQHELGRADGVFFTGGDQVRLAEVIGYTPAAHLLRRRFAREALPIAGTSAGASFLSEQMIARGWSGQRPRAGMVTLGTGLGVAPRLIIDQHFRERRREGRLRAAVALAPDCVGVGVDENTAAFIAPDGTMEVVGAGAVTVVDARGARPPADDPGERRTGVERRGLVRHAGPDRRAPAGSAGFDSAAIDSATFDSAASGRPGAGDRPRVHRVHAMRPSAPLFDPRTTRVCLVHAGECYLLDGAAHGPIAA